MRRPLILSLPIFLFLAVSVFALVQLDRSNKSNTSSMEQTRVVENPRKLSDEELKKVPEAELGTGLLVRLTPKGFEPSEVTVAAGRYYLLLQNASGLDQFAVRVDRENGSRLYDVRLEPYKRKWKQTLDLQPGRYIISEPDHPSSTCVITVTER